MQPQIGYDIYGCFLRVPHRQLLLIYSQLFPVVTFKRRILCLTRLTLVCLRTTSYGGLSQTNPVNLRQNAIKTSDPFTIVRIYELFSILMSPQSSLFDHSTALSTVPLSQSQSLYCRQKSEAFDTIVAETSPSLHRPYEAKNCLKVISAQEGMV